MALPQSEATAEELLAGLPHRLHHVFQPWAESAPGQPALIGDGKVWTYGDLPGIVDGAAEQLRSHGARPGDRIMIVSENSLALAALVLAASALDAWSVVVNPRLSERELDQIRDHCGARLVFYAVEVSELAAVHARRHDAHDGGHGSARHRGRRPAEREHRAGARRGGRRPPGGGPALHLGHDRQSEGRDAHAPQHPVQRQHLEDAAQAHAAGRDLRRAADVAHRRLLHHPGGNPDGRQRRPYRAEVRSGRFREGRPRRRHIAALRRAHDLPAAARIQGHERPQCPAARAPARPLRRRRTARSDPEGHDRAGIRPAVAQRLRHHRMRTGHFRRPLPRAARGLLGRHDPARRRGASGGPRRSARRQRRGRRAACARPQRDARLLPCTGGDRRGDRRRGLVQYRRSRALRRRGAVHRRPHQGADHPFGLQRLSGRSRSRPERAPVGRPVGGRRPRRPRQRGGRGLRAAAAGQRHHRRGADGARRPPSDGLQAAQRDRRARRPAGLVDGQDPEAPLAAAAAAAATTSSWPRRSK